MADTKKPETSSYDTLYEKLNGSEAAALRKDAQQKVVNHDVAGFLGDYVKAKVAGAKYEVGEVVDGIKAIPTAVKNLTTGGKSR